MNFNTVTATIIGAAIVAGLAFTWVSKKQETRIKHHITGDSFHHTFETKKGMKSRLSSVGIMAGTEYKERACINIEFASGYDFHVYHEPVSIDAAYKEITNPDYSQTDFKVIEKGTDFLIYKAMDGKIAFHSVLVNVKVGTESFSTITEQVHFDMQDKALVMSLEDCKEVIKIMRSIKKAD